MQRVKHGVFKDNPASSETHRFCQRRFKIYYWVHNICNLREVAAGNVWDLVTKTTFYQIF